MNVQVILHFLHFDKLNKKNVWYVTNKRINDAPGRLACRCHIGQREKS